MKQSITRRDILKLTGSGILGVMLSPLPWKLLDDSAIWTQNWERTPKLSHGPVTTLFSNCTLCNAGCGLQLKCVEGRPYYVSGVRLHPFTHGSLCARGISSHHMAHHPLRIIHPHTFSGNAGSSRMTAVSYQDAVSAVVQKIRSAKGRIAILDHQPGRAISEVYRSFLQETKNGIYLTSPSGENRTLDAVKEMLNNCKAELGYDFENAKLVVSFGAPLYDGWGIPGRMTALKNGQSCKFIQIDGDRSRTAMQSNQWISITPGTEKLLALSVVFVLLNDNLVSQSVRRTINDYSSFKTAVAQYSPEATSTATGISAKVVRALARELASAESAIILSGADPGGGPFDLETEKIIASLNLLIGNVGKSGGIVVKNNFPGQELHTAQIQWTSVPDHSIEVLIVDSSDSGYALPWNLIEQKLVEKNRCIVTLSPILNEISAHADYLIPAPGNFESLMEGPAPASNTTAVFSLSAPVLTRQENCVEPIELIKELSAKLSFALVIPTQEGSLRQRAETIHFAKRGSLFIYADQQTKSVSDYSTPDDLYNELLKGALWMDEPGKQIPVRSMTLSINLSPFFAEQQGGLKLIAYGWRGTTSSSQMSPIMSKLFQESDLRSSNGSVSIHPETAATLGLKKHEYATLSTKNGMMTVKITIDPTVHPNVIKASVGPLPNGAETPLNPAGDNILNLCEVKSTGTWRITDAQLLKV